MAWTKKFNEETGNWDILDDGIILTSFRNETLAKKVMKEYMNCKHNSVTSEIVQGNLVIFTCEDCMRVADIQIDMSTLEWID
jgi:hypothetical protein